MREKKRGDPQAAPWSFARMLIRGSLAGDAELGMRNGDVLGPALERQISRGVEPLEDVFAGFDPLDGRQPEALKFAFLVPVGSKDPCTDPQGFSRGGAIGLGGRRRGRGCPRGF